MERNLDAKYYVNSYDKEKDIYSSKENTLLLVIDEQPKLMNTMENGEQTILNTLVLINAFKEYGMPILATEQYPKGLGRSDDRLLAEIEENNIFAKSIFDAAIPEVIEYIRENKITNVVLTGAEGHICVYQTVRTLRDLGLNVFLAEDAVSSYSEELKNTALINMRDMGAMVVNTEMLLFDIARDSKDAHFKVISNLVKEIRARD
ncbi:MULTISPECIES: isochorismatase family protein [Anaerococcus]|jgi:isochorismatase hydrolase|uniref:Isochorismatase family protein n=1 Tax=Anaerococcus nagyae TaxID=1755241 RepID=A0A3E2TKS6_9FIRM|nr:MULTISPECIES: isochorismatase family protein [Anaerococcus]MDU1828441.1 isochorismatase family protein [Anaerococcus sp.]MDU1864853.1 isochorismatase family protein [Anaerococcus sp.]MDU2353648.1 isochorismatase family protein [Anaerococcus sp.]MDU2565312.1 isochorismatase family protein [Anaerococcus sp.]RGB77991.1 isochorismatase family protein [Anaerococcus nagyae]